MIKLVPLFFIIAIGLGLSGWMGNQPSTMDHQALKQQAIETLERLHKAEEAGDLEGILAVYSPDAWFLGTDKTEAWSLKNLPADLKKAFEGGWAFDLKSREVGVSQDGTTAWFREEVWFAPSGYTLRPTGTMTRINGEWRIMQLHMGTPVPNDVHSPFTQMTQAFENGTEVETKAIEAVLDSFHLAAANADGETYFGHFTTDGVFVGTDVKERWTVDEFKAYAEPYFTKGQGWVYSARTRWVALTPSLNSAWFLEVLDSKTYGTARGSGTLVREDGTWKVAQYHLTYPMPNEFAVEFTDKIKAFEKQQAGQE